MEPSRFWARARLGLVAATALLTSCAGETAQAIDSDLPKDRLFSDLGAEDLDTYCEAAFDALNEAYAGIDGCNAVAYLDAGQDYILGRDDYTDESLQASCDAYYRACLDDPGRNGGDITVQSCQSTPETMDSCQVTVGQMERCMNDRLKQSLGLLNVPSDCASITRAEVDAFADSEAATTDSGDPPSCDVVTAACPDGL